MRVGKVVFGVSGMEEVLWGFDGNGDGYRDGNRDDGDTGESNGSICGQ
jgi:hypothetical protein